MKIFCPRRSRKAVRRKIGWWRRRLRKNSRTAPTSRPLHWPTLPRRRRLWRLATRPTMKRTPIAHWAHQFPCNQNNLNFYRARMPSVCLVCLCRTGQGILKGEGSLYHWPPVWLVWNQLYDNWQFLFLFAKQTNPNQSNRRSTVQWYFPL